MKLAKHLWYPPVKITMILFYVLQTQSTALTRTNGSRLWQKKSRRWTTTVYGSSRTYQLANMRFRPAGSYASNARQMALSNVIAHGSLHAVSRSVRASIFRRRSVQSFDSTLFALYSPSQPSRVYKSGSLTSRQLSYTG